MKIRNVIILLAVALLAACDTKGSQQQDFVNILKPLTVEHVDEALGDTITLQEYKYDENGNIIFHSGVSEYVNVDDYNIPYFCVERNYRYDENGRIIEKKYKTSDPVMGVEGEKKVSYIYDDQKHLVSKIIDADTTFFEWNGLVRKTVSNDKSRYCIVTYDETFSKFVSMKVWKEFDKGIGKKDYLMEYNFDKFGMLTEIIQKSEGKVLNETKLSRDNNRVKITKSIYDKDATGFSYFGEPQTGTTVEYEAEYLPDGKYNKPLVIKRNYDFAPIIEEYVYNDKMLPVQYKSTESLNVATRTWSGNTSSNGHVKVTYLDKPTPTDELPECLDSRLLGFIVSHPFREAEWK